MDSTNDDDRNSISFGDFDPGPMEIPLSRLDVDTPRTQQSHTSEDTNNVTDAAQIFSDSQDSLPASLDENDSIVKCLHSATILLALAADITNFLPSRRLRGIHVFVSVLGSTERIGFLTSPPSR